MRYRSHIRDAVYTLNVIMIPTIKPTKPDSGKIKDIDRSLVHAYLSSRIAYRARTFFSGSRIDGTG